MALLAVTGVTLRGQHARPACPGSIGGDESPAREPLLRGAWALAFDFTFQRERLVARSIPVLDDEAVWQDNRDQAVDTLEQALATHRRLGQKPQMLELLRCLSLICLQRRDHPQAKVYLEQASAIARELNCRTYLAQVLHEWGCVFVYDGAFEKARPLLEEALELFRQPGGNFALGFAGNNLALALSHLGEVEDARRLYWDGLSFYANTEFWGYSPTSPKMDGIVWSLEGLARVGLDDEEAVRAARVLGAVSSLRDDPAFDTMHHWDAAVSALRAILGDDSFESVFKSACSMPYNQALGELINR